MSWIRRDGKRSGRRWVQIMQALHIWPFLFCILLGNLDRTKTRTTFYNFCPFQRPPDGRQKNSPENFRQQNFRWKFFPPPKKFPPKHFPPENVRRKNLPEKSAHWWSGPTTKKNHASSIIHHSSSIIHHASSIMHHPSSIIHPSIIVTIIIIIIIIVIIFFFCASDS